MGMMERMMGFMTERMSKEDKESMMGKMMEKFFAGMTVEDKQKMMMEMMPKMMEGVNLMDIMPQMMMGMMGGGGEKGSDKMGMMSRMMGGRQETSAGMMPNMMINMMPKCLDMMIPSIGKQERCDFVLDMVTTLVERGSEGMSDEEKKDFVARIVEKVIA
ncbi:hypothetical protein ACFLTS_03780 [Chloroflexota bacterium]